jgi:hypothetical protein
MLIFKSRIDFVLGSSLRPPKNQFYDGINSHKGPILWNQCLGALKVEKFGLWTEKGQTYVYSKE